MEVLSELQDGRIKSTNYMVLMTVKEYLENARNILGQNELQRRRVNSSKTIYSLLKHDILRGCIIPPIVLAITSVEQDKIPTKNNLSEFISANKNDLVILDGLQRTYTLVDLELELQTKNDEENLTKFYNHKLRFEIYVGINRLGILYRMLTLNTGQTPMSLRQQIEMLYLDYAKVPLDGITLVREAENRPANGINEFSFKDTLEGFNSYLERNELPIERTDLLENIKSLEKLSEENEDRDIYRDYVLAWHAFIVKINELAGNATTSEEEIKELGMPFGRTIIEVFKKSQGISGFGAAIGRLKDFSLIPDFEAIRLSANSFKLETNPEDFLKNINAKIRHINNTSKKIGNAQRMYFQYYFRELFNPQGDCYSKPDLAVDTAFQKYLSQNT